MTERDTSGGGKIDRRRALGIMSAAMASTLTRCQQPQDEIVPYVDMPERLVPGQPLRFATALPLAGYGRGAIAISVDGRPIKLEGNPKHPYSLGATDVFGEAEVLCLYDPDRSQTPLNQGRIASWQEFSDAWSRWSQGEAAGGEGVALLTGRITSPAMLRLLALWQQRFPKARHYRYEPVNDDAARTGARAAFGRDVETIPNIADADVVVALDADPLGPGPSLLANARAFAQRKRSAKPQRLYALESRWTLTGAAADHRIAITPQRIGEIARSLGGAFGLDLGTPSLPDEERRFAQILSDDLKQGRGLILTGETQPAAVHAFAHWLNEKVHAPVQFVVPADPHPDNHAQSFDACRADIQSRQIHTLIVLDANPVYDAPDAAELSYAIAALPFSLHCGMYNDETAEQCRWHLPLSHTLESWGDIKGPDGTSAIIQPLIQPLYDTRGPSEVLNLLSGGAQTTARDLVRATWKDFTTGDFETWWSRTLQDGFVTGSAAMPISLNARMPAMAPPAAATTGAFTLTIAQHPSLWDGRYANNAWLQECPAPFTKEVWGNAVHISPEDAIALNLSDGDGIVLRRGERDIDAHVAILKGQPKGVLAATLGGGRWRAGDIGSKAGARIGGLQSGFERVLDGVGIRASGTHDLLHTTQWHTRLDGEDKELFPLAASSEIKKRLAELKPPKHGIVPDIEPNQYAWAMVIDNDVCIGCNACVVACQAENNVAVVGPDEIARGRDMHWLRIDAYEISEASEVRRGFQPVPCMHCETAPCEPVCPVAASVHDHEGLNVQVYNRCIGTRFCEANCPYKVRHFNYFGYARGQEYGNLGQPPIGAQHNPNVSVRGRGVMEKCTYCVQRISAARRQAEKEDSAIADGEVVTACQAACPTRAIHFGNRNDGASDAARLQDDPRHYALLAHLDTRPRTTYLAKVYNPNPTLEGSTG